MPGRGSSWGGACLRGPRATEITPGAAWNEIEEKLRKRGQGGTVCWISREPGEGASVSAPSWCCCRSPYRVQGPCHPPGSLPAQASGVSLTSPCAPRPSPPLQRVMALKGPLLRLPWVSAALATSPSSVRHSRLDSSTPKAEPDLVPRAPRARFF